MQPYAPYPLNRLRDWLDRRRWWVRLALAVLLVPWFGQFAYVRVTTPSAGRPYDPWTFNLNPALAFPDPSVDRTKDLVAAIQALPPEPTFPPPTTAPAGMRWITGEDYQKLKAGQPLRQYQSPATLPRTISLDVNIAFTGPWTPDKRHHLQQIISYLESPGVSKALDQVAAVSDQPFCIADSESTRSGIGLAFMRQLARLFTARARYHLAEMDEFDAALRDIEAILELAAGLEDDQTLICMLVGIACRSLAISEMLCWIDEFHLSDNQIDSMIRLLYRQDVDRHELWNTAQRGEIALLRSSLDGMYTTGPDGWSVICDPRSVQGRDRILLIGNLLSPLYEDRRQAARWIDRFETATILPPDLPYADSIERLDAPFSWRTDSDFCCHEYPAPPYSPLLDLIFQFGGSTSRAYTLCNRTIAEHRGTIIALSLEAYRLDHERYPAELTALVPDYLDALPKDPFSDAPFCYRLDDEAGYVLYSVDHNGTDDGGARYSPPPDRDELDWPIRKPRGDGFYADEEWFLVPVE